MIILFLSSKIRKHYMFDYWLSKRLEDHFLTTTSQKLPNNFYRLKEKVFHLINGATCKS